MKVKDVIEGLLMYDLNIDVYIVVDDGIGEKKVTSISKLGDSLYLE